jgi:hypothetical protein
MSPIEPCFLGAGWGFLINVVAPKPIKRQSSHLTVYKHLNGPANHLALYKGKLIY